MLVDVAKLLSQTQIGLVVVCNPDMMMAGVITKSDVVRQIGHCAGSDRQTAAANVDDRTSDLLPGKRQIVRRFVKTHTHGYQ